MSGIRLQVDKPNLGSNKLFFQTSGFRIQASYFCFQTFPLPCYLRFIIIIQKIINY